MPPFSILRTKQRPRWPSCSRQSRGHRSHWMRPSERLCHHLPSIELHHPVAGNPAALQARVGRQSGFLQQLAEEHALVRNALPDLRKKRGPATLRLEDEAVLAGADLAHEIR